MTTPASARPASLEETGFEKNDGVYIGGSVYVCVGLYKGVKYDYLVVKSDDGRVFKAFLNTCQRIDGVLV